MKKSETDGEVGNNLSICTFDAISNTFCRYVLQRFCCFWATRTMMSATTMIAMMLAAMTIPMHADPHTALREGGVLVGEV